MLNPSEVWRRAYYEGRECRRFYSEDSRGNKLEWRNGIYTGPWLCAMGFLIEPYQDDAPEMSEWCFPEFRYTQLAKLYNVSQVWMREAESRYEGWNYPRHSLLELAQWAEAQGH